MAGYAAWLSVTGESLTSSVQLKRKTWHCQRLGDEKSVDVRTFLDGSSCAWSSVSVRITDVEYPIEVEDLASPTCQ